ncbi:hypothetical protein [Primorskyibacter sp. S87]|uniref:hypothetical protein n=1 Tax=Primorskyibacter sp. S87 TaxID=3415126 RepID=UPI003C7C9852
MRNLVLLPVLAAATLVSACDGWRYREGVGFTGIDGEPKTFEQANVQLVSRGASVSAELAGVAPIALQAKGSSQEDLAKVALANGGRRPPQAVEVGMGDRMMMLSNVSVNGTLFAVLRAPEGERVRLSENAGTAFVSAVPRLTGCLPKGNAYSQGRRPSALAVAVDCR